MSAQTDAFVAPISVVICTRNRGAQAAEAARAVLDDPTPFELIVVDQSTNDETVDALNSLPPDSRMRVVRSSLRGLSVARNTGAQAAQAPIIAFTDDDCRPASGWVSTLLRVFADEPDAAMVFGRVHLPTDQPTVGFAASFEPTQRVLLGIPDPKVALGIGANFAIRRRILEQLGGFDPFLGAGAEHLRAGEETDLLIRALHRGHRVINAVECDVLHLGVRSGMDIRPLVIGYQLGTGAAFGKLVRLSGAPGLKGFAERAAFYAAELARDCVQLRRPRPGVLCYFLAGAALTLRYRVDREQSVFKPR